MCVRRWISWNSSSENAQLFWILITSVGHRWLLYRHSESWVVRGIHEGPGNIPRLYGVSLRRGGFERKPSPRLRGHVGCSACLIEFNTWSHSVRCNCASNFSFLQTSILICFRLERHKVWKWFIVLPSVFQSPCLEVDRVAFHLFVPCSRPCIRVIWVHCLFDSFRSCRWWLTLIHYCKCLGCELGSLFR